MLTVLQQEIESIERVPDAMVAFFVSKALLVRELDDIYNVLPPIRRIMRSVIPEESEAESTDIYLFFN